MREPKLPASPKCQSFDYEVGEREGGVLASETRSDAKVRRNGV